MDKDTPQQNGRVENNQNTDINNSASNYTNKKSQTPLSQNHAEKIRIGFVKALLAIIAGIFVGAIISAVSIYLTSPDKTSFNDFLNSLLLSLALGFVTFVIVTILLIKTFRHSSTARLKVVIGCIFLVIIASVTARTLVVHSNNKIHAKEAAEVPLKVQATYAKTSNQDANIIVSAMSGAYLYRQEKVANTGQKSNEVNTLYCFVISNISAPNVVTALNTGLSKVPVMEPGASFMYTGNTTLPDGGSIPLTAEDISTLQSKFNQSNQIDMTFDISNQGSNSGYILALQTSNPNYYAQANVDIKVNTPSQTGQCVSLASNINTTNKLIVSLDMDLADDPAQWTVF